MPGAVFLEGDKVNLRTVEEEDLEFLRDAVNNPEIGKKISSDFKPKNFSQQREFFEQVISSDEGVHLGVSRDKDMIGMISILDEEPEVGRIGLWFAEEYQGNGYGTEASGIMIEYAFNQLNFHRILARSLETNKSSQKLWEKLGFTEEGEFREHVYRNGQYENLKLYGLLKEEWSQRK